MQLYSSKYLSEKTVNWTQFIPLLNSHQLGEKLPGFHGQSLPSRLDPVSRCFPRPYRRALMLENVIFGIRNFEN